MSAETRVRVRRVVIGIPRTAEDRGDLDSALQTLFPKSQALEFFETVLLRDAVYDGVPQKVFSHAGNEGCSLDISATTSVFGVGCVHGIFEFPRGSTLVVQQAWVVVALVKILEDTGKDLRFLVWKIDPLTLSLEKLSSASRRKKKATDRGRLRALRKVVPRARPSE